MYKDKDKQREANAERQRRYKARHKGVTSEGVTDKALPDGTMSIETLAMVDAGCGNNLYFLRTSVKFFIDVMTFL